MKKFSDKTQASFDLLANKVEEMYKSPDVFKNWLSIHLNLNHYSPLNRTFIFIQNPDAKYVSSYKSWEKLGFPVIRKGKINVLKPIFLKGYINENGKWRSLQSATEDEKEKIKEGKLITKDRLRDYHHVPVFDISCTNATEKDLVKLIQSKNQTKYPMSPSEVRDKLARFLNYESEITEENIYEDIYSIVHNYIFDIVKEDLDKEEQKIVADSVTFTVLNQMQLDTSLFEFNILNNIHYESDFDNLMKLNKKICYGTEYIIDRLSAAFQ